MLDVGGICALKPMDVLNERVVEKEVLFGKGLNSVFLSDRAIIK